MLSVRTRSFFGEQVDSLKEQLLKRRGGAIERLPVIGDKLRIARDEFETVRRAAAQPPAPTDKLPEGFSLEEFLQLARRVLSSQGSPAITEEPQPLALRDIPPVPRAGTKRYDHFREIGEQALREGKVATVIVAGGAATRFGGSVKGLVPVYKGKTFLDVKLADAKRTGETYGHAIQAAVMTSALTHDQIAEHLAHRRGTSNVQLFQQRMLPRLDSEGGLFRDEHGELSWAPAGHGDFFRAFKESGVAQALYDAGVEHFMFSNVDNLAATLDPVLVGMHIEQARKGFAITGEMTPRGTDVGGYPVRKGDRIALAEHVDPEGHKVINTNNLWFDLKRVLDAKIDLPWKVANKKVGDTPVLQLETMAADAPDLIGADGRPELPMAVVRIPREGESSRFEPVKAPEDLKPVVARLAARLDVLIGSRRSPSES